MRIANSVKSIILIFMFSLVAGCDRTNKPDYGSEFIGSRAYIDIEQQLNFGPRYTGSDGHAQMIHWLAGNLEDCGWQVEIQQLKFEGQVIRNVVAKRGDEGNWLILGAHYDTRLVADQDPHPEKRGQPVMGANDGASGVAVLLELARVLPKDIDQQVWLVFFDAEDNGHIPGWDWILGSRAFVEQLEGEPNAVVIVDMVGDADLNLYYENNSDNELSQQIWQQAAVLGYDGEFIPQVKYSMLDDHTPFLQAGIRAVDIIDFDYPFWHTTEDTLDKVSAASLDAVGDTLLQWMLENKQLGD